MINKILPFLKESLPTAVAFKGIGQSSPKLKKFLLGAAASGYAADEVIDYLRGVAESPNKRSEKADIGARVRKGTARPDEEATLQELTAGDKPLRAIKTAASAAGGLASAAGGIASLLGEEGGDEEVDVTETETETVEDGTGKGYFEKATQGISFFDIPDESKPGISKLKKRIDELESQQVPFADSSVQKIVKAIKKLLSGKGAGLVAREQARFEQGNVQQKSQKGTQEIESLLSQYGL